MSREAFTMKLKPGAFAEYKRLHDEIWPELVAQIHESGVATMSIFESDPDLVLVSEIRDPETWTKLWASEVHQRWAEVIWPLLEAGPDGRPLIGELREIFRLE